MNMPFFLSPSLGKAGKRALKNRFSKHVLGSTPPMPLHTPASTVAAHTKLAHFGAPEKPLGFISIPSHGMAQSNKISPDSMP